MEIIDELRPNAQAILVSSHARERAVQEKCGALGIKILPKELIGSVPLTVSRKERNPSQAPKAVLVDDDKLMRLSWSIAAEQAGINLITFRTGKELFETIDSIDRSTPTYIDCILDKGESGIDLTRALSALGFTELYLATGRPPHTLEAMPWLRGIQGKYPPWASLLDTSRNGPQRSDRNAD